MNLFRRMLRHASTVSLLLMVTIAALIAYVATGSTAWTVAAGIAAGFGYLLHLLERISFAALQTRVAFEIRHKPPI